MRILSWNVNGLHARLDAVNRIVEQFKPDVMCFQKVRGKGHFLIQIPGYMGWLGTLEDGLFGGASIYTRQDLEIDFHSQGSDMPEWLMSTNCLNVLRLGQFNIINAYFPYANKDNEEFIKIRQRWDYEFHDYIERLSNRKPLILCGDLNIVADKIDAWDDIHVKNAGCFFPWEHRNFDSMIKQADLVDSYRYLHPDKREYSYFFQNRPEYRLANQGHRIDYFIVSRKIMPFVDKSEILTEIFDTDSSPILLDINIPKYF